MAALLAAAAFAPAALGQTVYSEAEPNDTKWAANETFVMAAGDSIIGFTTGSSTTPGDASADNFIIQTAAAPPGIYLHRLVITTDGPAGHTGTIRGLTQTNGMINFGSDAALQTSSATTNPPRYVQWYGFGKQEQVYVRITGTASTTGMYTATLETIPVSIIDLGAYYNGMITIDRPPGDTTDIDFWVYDADFNAIPDYGNDMPDSLTRFFAPGTYYIAYTNWNMANDQPAASDEGFRSGNVTDFPNVVVNNSTALYPNLGVRLTDAFDQVVIPTPKTSPFEVVWLRFTVTDTPPATGACCLPDGTCVAATASRCLSQGGVYHGDNTGCDAVNCPQPGACCLPEFNCMILAASECASLGGVFQGEGTACGNCPAPPPGSVLILGGDSATNINDVRSKLVGTGLIPYVGVGNVTSATPTLAALQQFDAVLVFSNLNFHDNVALGDVLADYVDAGGGVVVSMYTVATTTANRFLSGRWDETYQIIPQRGGNSSSSGEGLGAVLIPDHPIMQSVNSFVGGSLSSRPRTTDLTFHGVKVAEWTDGKTLVAVSNTRPNRVDLGFFPPSSDVGTSNWDASTDGARLMANALLYTMGGGEACTADYNTDGQVNSNDISAFLSAWLDSVQHGNLIADFNLDGSVNSNDISAFLSAWLDAVQDGC